MMQTRLCLLVAVLALAAGTVNADDTALTWPGQTKEQLAEFKEYITDLKNNASLPMVHFNVSIAGEDAGTIDFVLFPDVAPRAAENFRRLSTGEKGRIPEGKLGAGLNYTFEGAYFYRIIYNFIDQAGLDIESTLGNYTFKDDEGGLELLHDRKGRLSMANFGKDTNTAHFSIMMGPQPHLNTFYTIFGQVVDGFEVVDAINILAKDAPELTANKTADVVIESAWQSRKGTIIPDLGDELGEAAWEGIDIDNLVDDPDAMMDDEDATSGAYAAVAPMLSVAAALFLAVSVLFS